MTAPSDPTLSSPYYDRAHIEAMVRKGEHRSIVGGLWDEIGQLQIGLMIERGLQPSHKLLDIGCGCLRGGLHFIRYLDSGNYYGTDINAALLQAGRGEAGAAGLGEKLPAQNLKEDADFAVGAFNVMFDYVLAFSVFTHTPLNHARVCLERLVEATAPGALFIATFFEIPPEAPSWRSYKHAPADVVTHALQDPYHYHASDFAYAVAGLPWEIENVGAFDHPRGQHRIEFRRTRAP